MLKVSLPGLQVPELVVFMSCSLALEKARALAGVQDGAGQGRQGEATFALLSACV